VPDCPVVSCEEMASRVHMALKYLLRLIPSASSTMVPILSARFPFVEDSKKAHMEYINNLIRLIEYAPELKSDVFALITERLVKIDARVQKDLDDIDEKLAADILQSSEDREVGDMEDDSDADSVSSEEEDDDDEDPDEMKVLQGNVEKMDAILDKLFQVYTPYFEDPNSGDAHRMFDTLLSHFRNIILPTYRSRHTQFLLFHFAQTSELLIDTFAGECVDLAFKSGRPAILKHSAAAYLASFVARGARVPAVVVRDVFDYIGTCIDAIREDNEQTCRGPDLQRYGTFYANTQALLYIFCFRWRDLVVSATGDEEFDDDDPAALLGRDLRWRTGVRELLSRTIYSKLNPLKICAQPIVQEFAKIALKLNFMMIYPLLESNKRVRLSQYTRGVGGGNNAIRETNFNPADGDVDSWHQLDAYFPFDPYQLPLSRRWVDDDYVEWKGLPGDMDEDEMDDTSDVEDEDLEYDDEDVQTATETDDEE
jgi:RNA polymerase I-specific transcription initiation factor RRN3